MNRYLGERGAALVIALLVLLILSFLEVALIVTTTTETKISGTHLRDRQALEAAEAGVEEVVTRMALEVGDAHYIGDSDFPLEPHWVTVVHLGTREDTVEDTIYTKTVQLSNPDEQVLYYTTDDLTDYDDLLIVRHKTGGANGESLYFCDVTDRSQYLEAPNHGGFPVEVIEVNGRRANAERRVVAEVARILWPVTVPADAALYIGHVMDFKATDPPGKLLVCGHNHPRALPLASGGYDPPDCGGPDLEYHTDPCLFPWQGEGTEITTWGNRDPDNCDPAGCVVGVKFPNICVWPTQGTVDRELYGNPAWKKVPLVLDSLPPLWKVLGFECADSMEAKITWEPIQPGDKARGMCKVTAGSYQVTGPDTGWGVLWVKGPNNDTDFKLLENADYYFEGLIYVEGGIRSHETSRLRVLGSTMLRKGGHQPPECNAGDLTFCYSSQAIGWYLMEHLGLYTILSWREK